MPPEDGTTPVHERFLAHLDGFLNHHISQEEAEQEVWYQVVSMMPDFTVEQQVLMKWTRAAAFVEALTMVEDELGRLKKAYEGGA